MNRTCLTIALLLTVACAEPVNAPAQKDPVRAEVGGAGGHRPIVGGDGESLHYGGGELGVIVFDGDDGSRFQVGAMRHLATGVDCVPTKLQSGTWRCLPIAQAHQCAFLDPQCETTPIHRVRNGLPVPSYVTLEKCYGPGVISAHMVEPVPLPTINQNPATKVYQRHSETNCSEVVGWTIGEFWFYALGPDVSGTFTAMTREVVE